MYEADDEEDPENVDEYEDLMASSQDDLDDGYLRDEEFDWYSNPEDTETDDEDWMVESEEASEDGYDGDWNVHLTSGCPLRRPL